jgi:hypothetical protein
LDEYYEFVVKLSKEGGQVGVPIFKCIFFCQFSAYLLSPKKKETGFVFDRASSM